VVVVEHLSFSYPGSDLKALNDLSFKAAPGEFVGITGPTGAGKSTFILCLNGIIPHFQQGTFHGAVLINGLDTFKTTCAELSGQVGSVFQDPEAQIVAPVVEEELAFGLENLAFPPAEIDRRIDEALELTGIASLRHRSTTQLSGGQKQRVAIAAAIALKPHLLLLDEPTSELDPIGTMEVYEVLRMLNREQGLTVIVVEQKINLLVEYAGRLVVMQHGAIAHDGPPREIIEEPELLVSAGLKPPPVGDLALRLKRHGIYPNPLPVSVEEAYTGVCGTLAKKGIR